MDTLSVELIEGRPTSLDLLLTFLLSCLVTRLGGKRSIFSSIGGERDVFLSSEKEAPYEMIEFIFSAAELVDGRSTSLGLLLTFLLSCLVTHLGDKGLVFSSVEGEGNVLLTSKKEDPYEAIGLIFSTAELVEGRLMFLDPLPAFALHCRVTLLEDEGLVFSSIEDDSNMLLTSIKEGPYGVIGSTEAIVNAGFSSTEEKGIELFISIGDKDTGITSVELIEVETTSLDLLLTPLLSCLVTLLGKERLVFSSQEDDGTVPSESTEEYLGGFIFSLVSVTPSEGKEVGEGFSSMREKGMVCFASSQEEPNEEERFITSIELGEGRSISLLTLLLSCLDARLGEEGLFFSSIEDEGSVLLISIEKGFNFSATVETNEGKEVQKGSGVVFFKSIKEDPSEDLGFVLVELVGGGPISLDLLFTLMLVCAQGSVFSSVEADGMMP